MYTESTPAHREAPRTIPRIVILSNGLKAWGTRDLALFVKGKKQLHIFIGHGAEVVQTIGVADLDHPWAIVSGHTPELISRLPLGKEIIVG